MNYSLLSVVFVLFFHFAFSANSVDVTNIENIKPYNSANFINSDAGYNGWMGIIINDQNTSMIVLHAYQRGVEKWKSNITPNYNAIPEYFRVVIGADGISVTGLFLKAFVLDNNNVVPLNSSGSYLLAKFDIDSGISKWVTVFERPFQYYPFLKEDKATGFLYLAGVDPKATYDKTYYGEGVLLLAFNSTDGIMLQDPQRLFFPSASERYATVEGFDVFDGQILFGIAAQANTSQTTLLRECDGETLTGTMENVNKFVLHYVNFKCAHQMAFEGSDRLLDVSYGPNRAINIVTYTSSLSSVNVNIMQFNALNGSGVWRNSFDGSSFQGFSSIAMDTSTVSGITILSGAFQFSDVLNKRQIVIPPSFLVSISSDGATVIRHPASNTKSLDVSFAEDESFALISGTYLSAPASLNDMTLFANESYFSLLVSAVESAPSPSEEPNPTLPPNGNYCQNGLTMCSDGRCVSSELKCRCLDNTTLRCFDGSCMEACPKAPYEIVPEPISQELQPLSGIVITLPAAQTVEETVGSIVVDIGSFATTDNSTLNVTVRAVNTSELIDAKLPDGFSPTGLSHVVSSVIVLEVSPNVIQPFASPVKISLKVTLPSDFSPLKYTTFCLAFINSTKQWECVDNNLMTDDNVTYYGYTTHFTPFGVLLTGKKDESKAPEDDEVVGGDGHSGEEVPVKVVVPIVVCIIVVVIVAIVVGVIINNRRKKQFRDKLKAKGTLISNNEASP